jgi:hypothetical protein
MTTVVPRPRPRRPRSRPMTFWLVAVGALVWNAIGVAMFFMQVTRSPASLAAMPPAQRAVYEATPLALHAAFAVAVLAGLLGAAALLLGRRWAAPLFVVSLVALVVQLALAYTLTPAWEGFGPAGLVMPVILLAVAVFLVWYARRAAARGWLR